MWWRRRRISYCFVASLPLVAGQGGFDEGGVEFLPRNYSGIGNNIFSPTWGSVGTAQVKRENKMYYTNNSLKEGLTDATRRHPDSFPEEVLTLISTYHADHSSA